MKYTLFILLTAVLVVAGPVEDLQPGQWYEVPNSRMDAVGWPVRDYPDMLRTNGYTVAGVMDAWAGGAFDTKRNRLVVWGGGHNSYSGNELYAFDMDDLKWSRVNDPNTNPTRCSDINADGTPVARHTYNQVEYIVHGDRFFGHGGACDCGAGGACPSASTWLFDFDNLRWSKEAACPTGSRYGSNCCYDPVTRRVYFHSADGGMGSFNCATGTWIRHNTFGGAYYRPSAVDPKRRLIIEVGHSQAMRAYNLAVNNLQGAEVVTSGPQDVTNISNPGWAYDPVTERFIGWTSGNSVFSYDPDTKIWEKHNAANSVDPGSRNQNGTYGRFRYVPSRNVFIVANEVSRNVFVYKHTAPATAPQWYLDMIDPNTSVENVRKLANSGLAVQASPNPFKSRTVITISKKFRVPSFELQIFDITGKQLETRNLKLATRNSFSWNASGLPAGIYLLKAFMGKKQVTKRLFLTK